jgi:hypothetical protein
MVILIFSSKDHKWRMDRLSEVVCMYILLVLSFFSYGKLFYRNLDFNFY